jgi:hypothetical protein
MFRRAVSTIEGVKAGQYAHGCIRAGQTADHLCAQTLSFRTRYHSTWSPLLECTLCITFFRLDGERAGYDARLHLD